MVDIQSSFRWKVIGDANEATSKCALCGGACVPKDIGDICVGCLETIPAHIPKEQTHKYLNLKFKAKKS